jgi:hypothetical protein
MPKCRSLSTKRSQGSEKTDGKPGSNSSGVASSDSDSDVSTDTDFLRLIQTGERCGFDFEVADGFRCCHPVATLGTRVARDSMNYSFSSINGGNAHVEDGLPVEVLALGTDALALEIDVG